MSRKTNYLKLHLPDPNEFYDIELDQNKNFELIDDVLTPATKSEIESILNQRLIKDVLELATEQDIRNLFVGTILEGGATYNLSSLSTDESRVVNMRLLSLFNDLLLQKISDKDNVLDKNLRDYINSVKTSLQGVNITAGTGLKGGGSLSGNITLSLDYGTAEEVKNTLK